MPLEIRKAIRRALPLQIALYGPSGSGKTFSALLLAAGLSPNGKVVVIDTERGRASLYADNKKILAALPGGFDVVELDAPYHPERYIEALDRCEAAGYKVCLVDSGSDSWDGPGGCTDLAEAAKGMWAKPKLWNKRMMTRSALSTMHIIWLLKAQEKTKVIGKDKSRTGKQEYVELGMLPIWEKNNFFPMLLGFSVDPVTHMSTVVKCHDDLVEFFPTPKLITKVDGERIREWNETGQAVADPHERLKKRAQSVAEQGIESYEAFFKSLTTVEKKALIDSTHAENKAVAQMATDAKTEPTEDLTDWVDDPNATEEERRLDPGPLAQPEGKEVPA